MWEEDIFLGWQKLPVGSWFLTCLSVYRANASNRWETDLIMFSFFFPQFPFSGRFVLSSFKPQRYISFHTQTFGRSRARPPRLSVTFQVFQKCCCLFMCRTKISCRPAQGLVGGSETQKMYYYIYLTMIQICQGSEGMWKYKQWLLSRTLN